MSSSGPPRFDCQPTQLSVVDQVDPTLFQRLARETRHQIFEYVIHDALLEGVHALDEAEARKIHYLRDEIDRYMKKRLSTIMVRMPHETTDDEVLAIAEELGIRYVGFEMLSSDKDQISIALAIKHAVNQIFRMQSYEFLHDFVWTLERLRTHYKSQHLLPDDSETDYDLEQDTYHPRAALSGDEGEHLVSNIQHISKAQFNVFEKILFKTNIIINPYYTNKVSWITNRRPNKRLPGGSDINIWGPLRNGHWPSNSRIYGNVCESQVEGWQDVVLAERERRDCITFWGKFYDKNLTHAQDCCKFFIEAMEECERLG